MCFLNTAKQLKQRRAARRTPKKRSRAAEQSLGGIAYEDLVDSESLLQPISDQELQSDEESSLDIGIKVAFNLGLVARKPVFGVSEKAKLKPACSATETS